MAQRLAYAESVQQRGKGHCGTAQANLGTMNKIRRYSRDDSVPSVLALDDRKGSKKCPVGKV